MADEEPLSKLFELACEARRMAYAPYSGFSVGAALETGDGRFYTGCNVENSAYGLSRCAEQVAIAKAVSEGNRKFRRLVVVASPLAAPCGACRQVIGEFFDDEALVHAFDATDRTLSSRWSVAGLLPDRFRLRR